MDAQKFRILEWTNEFGNGTRETEFELQYQDWEHKWNSLGTSGTLKDARRALLFHMPSESFGCS